jgi:Family of unknown function (DUF6600)
MRALRFPGSRLSLAALMICAPVFAAAAEAPAPLRVGRIGLVTGKVEFRPVGATAWSAAALDDPVAAGTAVRTDALARAEIRIGTQTIDLAGGSEAGIVQLDDRATELALRQGRIELRLRALVNRETVTIDVPQGRVRLLLPGAYDVTAAPARVAVFAGRAHFTGTGLDLAIEPGTAALLNGDKPATAATEPAAGDAFFAWAQARADAVARAALPDDVSSEITGLAALAGRGRWQHIAGLGAAWFPDDLPADWAPYRYGHWRWIEPWGWTWIDDRPWGFAPSHYGRWASIGGRWAWLPGAAGAPPAYAPALANFLGTPAVGVSFAEGSGPAIGWFPLAPGEIYWPRYSRDLGYIRRLNTAAVPDPQAIRLGPDGAPPVESVTRHFANRAFATIVPRRVFIRGEPVATMQVQLPERRLANVPVLLGAPRIGAPPPPRVVVAAPPRPPVAVPHPARRQASPAHRVAARAAAHHAVARAEHHHQKGPHNRVPTAARAPHRTHVRLATLHGHPLASARAPHARHEPHRALRRTARR